MPGAASERLLLRALHAVRGDWDWPLASWAIALTHWLKGVPLVPGAASERCRLWPWHFLP